MEENFNLRFFISNTFTSNIRLILGKSQAKAKQHPQAGLFLFENYSLSLFILSFKINFKCVRFNEII